MARTLRTVYGLCTCFVVWERGLNITFILFDIPKYQKNGEKGTLFTL